MKISTRSTLGFLWAYTTWIQWVSLHLLPLLCVILRGVYLCSSKWKLSRRDDFRDFKDLKDLQVGYRRRERRCLFRNLVQTVSRHNCCAIFKLNKFKTCNYILKTLFCQLSPLTWHQKKRYLLILCFALGSRPYPVMATPYADEQQVSTIPSPTSVAVREASPQLTGPNQRTSPRDSPQARIAQTSSAKEREANKQIQKESVKRKHDENDRSNNTKKVKLQSTQKTDGPTEMLRKLEEARLRDKKDLPCEWPRVADGEFILENGEPKIWHCGQCDKSFAQRSLLQMHICSRNPNRPYQCGHCAQEFAHPNELRTHAVIHSGKKPFKCGFCSRTFAGATTLNNHVRTHTGERPFTCNKCYKTFSQASQLSKHKRSLYECFSWECFCREYSRNNFTLATIRLRGVINMYISCKKRLLCILQLETLWGVT